MQTSTQENAYNGVKEIVFIIPQMMRDATRN